MNRKLWFLSLNTILVSSASLAVAVGTLSVKAQETTSASSIEASPVFGVTLPPGYRDWQFISVAHEAGNNNDIRGILANDVATKALKEGTLPFPDGSIIVRL